MNDFDIKFDITFGQGLTLGVINKSHVRFLKNYGKSVMAIMAIRDIDVSHLSPKGVKLYKAIIPCNINNLLPSIQWLLILFSEHRLAYSTI